MPDKIEDVEKKLLKEIKKEDRIHYLASFPNLVDLVENDDGKLEFLVFDPISKTSSATPIVQLDGKTYEPPLKSLLPKNMFFAKKENVTHFIHERINQYQYNTNNNINNTNNTGDTGDTGDLENKEIAAIPCNEWDVNLYDEIISYYQERAELPEDNLYDVLALWAFHTYSMERADFSPIIYFLGLPEKGKSRMLKAMIYIARRGLRKISLTDAQILRDCTHLEATIAMDMMNLWKKVEAAGSEDVFLNRPEKGIDVSRVNRPEKGAFADTDYYTVFGPTIFATNEMIDEILETRAIPIIMTKAKKEFTLKVRPEDGIMIKEKLTAWRACTMGDAWPDVGRIAQSRLGDITQPLYQLVKMIHPARESAIVEIVQKIESRRIKEKADSTSGQILRSLWLCKHETTHGYVKSQQVTDNFNKDKNEREKMSSRKIFNKLKAMGFEPTISSEGTAAVIWNDILIDKLLYEFGIEKENDAFPSIPISPVSPETPETPEEMYYSDLAEKEEKLTT